VLLRLYYQNCFVFSQFLLFTHRTPAPSSCVTLIYCVNTPEQNNRIIGVNIAPNDLGAGVQLLSQNEGQDKNYQRDEEALERW